MVPASGENEEVIVLGPHKKRRPNRIGFLQVPGCMRSKVSGCFSYSVAVFPSTKVMLQGVTSFGVDTCVMTFRGTRLSRSFCMIIFPAEVTQKMQHCTRFLFCWKER